MIIRARYFVLFLIPFAWSFFPHTSWADWRPDREFSPATIDSLGAEYPDAGAVYLYWAELVTAGYDPGSDSLEGEITYEYELWIRDSSRLEENSRVQVADDPHTRLESVDIEIRTMAGKKIHDLDKGDLTWNSWLDDGGGVVNLDRERSFAVVPGLAVGHRIRVRIHYEFSDHHGMPNLSLGGSEYPCAWEGVQIEVPRDLELSWEAVGPAHLEAAMLRDTVTDGDTERYSWWIENVPTRSRTDEQEVDDLRLRIVTHLSVPARDGATGSFAAGRTWADVARTYRELIDDRMTVTPEIAAQAKRLTADASSDLQKIDLLYAHVQQTTRYLGIYEGLEGIIPETAASVMANKFGDCKGLGVYLIALLRAVGIEAWPVLVRTDHLGSLAETVPNPNQFNHFIVWADDGKDGIWLDATLEECPVGAIYPQDARSPVLTMRPGHEGLVEIPYDAWHPGVIVYRLTGAIDASNLLVLRADLEASGVTGIRLRSRRCGMTEKQGCNLRKSILLPESLPMREGAGTFDSAEDWSRPVRWSLESRGSRPLPGTRTSLFLPATLVGIPVPEKISDPRQRPDRREVWAIALPAGMEAVPDTLEVDRAGLSWKRMVWQEGDTLRLAREIKWDRTSQAKVAESERFGAEKEAFAAEKAFITLNKVSKP